MRVRYRTRPDLTCSSFILDSDDPICVHFLLYETSTGSDIPVGNVRLLEKKNKVRL
jgi:hypothetical protein